MKALTAGRLLVLLGLALQPAVAEAADCTISSFGVNFGVYDPLSASADDSTGQLSVSCSLVAQGPPETVTYSIQLSAGNAGSFNPRRLLAGAQWLGYNLYRDAGRSEVWGDGLGSTFTVANSIRLGPGVGNSSRSRTDTIYGRVPAGQDAYPGSYADSIVITLEF